LRPPQNVRERYPRQGKQTLLFLKKKTRAAGTTKRTFFESRPKAFKTPGSSKKKFLRRFFQKAAPCLALLTGFCRLAEVASFCLAPGVPVF
jgi:hypothetical protein